MERGTIMICHITGGKPGYDGTFAVLTCEPDRSISEMKEEYGGNIEILKRIDMETRCGRYFHNMMDDLRLCTVVDEKVASPNGLMRYREIRRIQDSGLGPLEKIDLYEKEAIRYAEHAKDHFLIYRVET